jgi:hypothetical protein
MRELFLHIGLHKTGTTYLQHVLMANRAAFAAAGLAPAPFLHPREGNHYPMIRALRAEGFAPEAFARVMDAVAAAPGEKLVVTAEELCVTIMPHRARAEALRDAAARHFRPRVIVFLRRQDFLKESAYGQAARTWLQGGIRDDDHYDLDHDARLRGLEDVFGRENLRVAIYGDGVPGFDPLDGFLAALGLDIDRAALRPVPRRNLSLHRREVLFMAALPKGDARRDRIRMQPVRQIARALQASGAIADDGGRFLLAPDERHALVARHLEGNRALVARHGLTDVGRFLDLPDPDEPWSPPAAITAAERVHAFRAVVRAAWARRNPVEAAAAMARAGFAFARARP